MEDPFFKYWFIGRILVAGVLMIFLVTYVMGFAEAVLKEREEAARRRRKQLVRQQEKAAKQLIRDRATEMVKSIVAVIGTSQAVDLVKLRKACKWELQRFQRENDRQCESVPHNTA